MLSKAELEGSVLTADMRIGSLHGPNCTWCAWEGKPLKRTALDTAGQSLHAFHFGKGRKNQRWIGMNANHAKIVRGFSTLAINKTNWRLCVSMWSDMYMYIYIYNYIHILLYFHVFWLWNWALSGFDQLCVWHLLFRHDCETCINECKRHVCLLQVDFAEFVFDLCGKMKHSHEKMQPVCECSRSILQITWHANWSRWTGWNMVLKTPGYHETCSLIRSEVCAWRLFTSRDALRVFNGNFPRTRRIPSGRSKAFAIFRKFWSGKARSSARVGRFWVTRKNLWNLMD